MSNANSQTEPERPAYVWEMLKRPLNVNLGLATLAMASFLAIPFGGAGFVLPVLLFGAGEAIASMFIPSSASFRVKIDREFAVRRREETSAHLRNELMRRVGGEGDRWRTYARLCERIDSLREMAKHRRSGINERDLLRLEEGCVDYLGLWLAEQSMVERQDAIDEPGVERRILEIRERIAAGADDSRSLQKASADLEELLLRHRRLASRRAAVEAALLSLPDAFDEIYDAVVTLPAGGEGTTRLQEAIDRLRLEEELESSFGDEIREIAPYVPRHAAAARLASTIGADRPPPPPPSPPARTAPGATRNDGRTGPRASHTTRKQADE